MQFSVKMILFKTKKNISFFFQPNIYFSQFHKSIFYRYKLTIDISQQRIKILKINHLHMFTLVNSYE